MVCISQHYKNKIMNNIIIKNNYAELNVYYKKHDTYYKSLIDIDDVEKIQNYHWNLVQGYARSYIKEIYQYKSLHQIILNLYHNNNINYIIDHINRNRLDCRKLNLRIVTYQDNAINKGMQSNNISGHTGVSWDKCKNKWEAHIK